MEELSNLKLPDLKKECKIRGLSVTGSKSELQARLYSAIAMAAKTPITEDSVILDDSLLDDDSDDSSGAGSSNEDSNLVDLISETSPPPSVSDELREKKPIETIKRPVVTSPIKKGVSVTDKQDDDASPPKKKKIILNRQPLPVILPSSTENSDVKEGEKKVVKISVITSSAEDKAKLRQQKFGISSESNKIETSKPTFASNSAVNPLTDSRLKKRAERFNVDSTSTVTVTKNVTGVVSLTSEADLKLAKRKERFGVETTNDPDKKDKRAARFGTSGTASSVVAPAAVASVDITDDKKKLRAARFQAAP